MSIISWTYFFQVKNLAFNNYALNNYLFSSFSSNYHKTRDIELISVKKRLISIIRMSLHHTVIIFDNPSVPHLNYFYCRLINCGVKQFNLLNKFSLSFNGNKQEVISTTYWNILIAKMKDQIYLIDHIDK